MRGVPKVALLIETARGYGRGLLRGIVRYARVHGPWAFYVTPGDSVQSLPKMQQWGGTGIIARLETPQIVQAVLKTALPTIALDLSDAQLRSDSPLRRFSRFVPISRGRPGWLPSTSWSGISAITPTWESRPGLVAAARRGVLPAD